MFNTFFRNVEIVLLCYLPPNLRERRQKRNAKADLNNYCFNYGIFLAYEGLENVKPTAIYLYLIIAIAVLSQEVQKLSYRLLSDVCISIL